MDGQRTPGRPRLTTRDARTSWAPQVSGPAGDTIGSSLCRSPLRWGQSKVFPASYRNGCSVANVGRRGPSQNDGRPFPPSLVGQEPDPGGEEPHNLHHHQHDPDHPGGRGTEAEPRQHPRAIQAERPQSCRSHSQPPSMPEASPSGPPSRRPDAQPWNLFSAGTIPSPANCRLEQGVAVGSCRETAHRPLTKPLSVRHDHGPKEMGDRTQRRSLA